MYSRHFDCHRNPQDGSGTISTVELLHVLRAMGQNPSEVELNTIIMEIDIDGSGTIDFMEFVNLMKEKLNDVDIENDIREEVVLHSHIALWQNLILGLELDNNCYRDAFRMFDRNMDGYIDMSELRKMFAMVGVGDGGVFSRDEMEEFMEEADRVSVKCCVCVTKLST